MAIYSQNRCFSQIVDQILFFHFLIFFILSFLMSCEIA